MRSVVYQIVGYAFLVLGVLGLFLPVLQGVLFILIGLLILSRHAPWAERLLQRFRDHHPKAAELIDRAEERAAGWWRRVAGLGRRGGGRIE